MTSAEITLVLLVEALTGAAAATAVGRGSRTSCVRHASLAVTGAICGILLALLAAQVPGIGYFVGYVGSALDEASRVPEGLSSTILLGAGVAGLLGGAVGAGLVSLAGRRTQ